MIRKWFFSANILNNEGKAHIFLSGVIETNKTGEELYDLCKEFIKNNEEKRRGVKPLTLQIQIVSLNRLD